MTSSNPYGLRANGCGHGDVFTSPEVVKFMLDLVDYTPNCDLSKITILEPSCGDGEFLVEIAKRLIESAKTYQFDANQVFSHCVFGFDIDLKNINRCKERIQALGINVNSLNLCLGNFLLCDIPEADIVIGNPPYVRYENIPEADRRYYKAFFPSFHYRSDLYIPFFEKTLKHLKPGGKHCFICANRWLKNEYGKKLRSMIANQFRLHTIINLEKANAFQENVLAYPAITLIINQLPCASLNFADIDDVANLQEITFDRRKAPTNNDWTNLFNSTISDSNLYTIEELGFKIGIGAATGADRIFISSQLPKLVERELLLPAINARDLRGDHLRWSGEYLLNPYQANGELINLDCYPKALQYLEQHKELLSRRHVAQKNISKWYKTIDRIYPNLKNEAKILLPDMSSNRYVFVDEGNYYPLHNLYYITGLTVKEQKLLSALLISDKIRQQLVNITNNMNGGFPRWQSQYLRKLRIPNIKNLDKNLCNNIISSYEQRDYHFINELVNNLFVDIPHRNRKHQRYHQVINIPFEYPD